MCVVGEHVCRVQKLSSSCVQCLRLVCHSKVFFLSVTVHGSAGKGYGAELAVVPELGRLTLLRCAAASSSGGVLVHIKLAQVRSLLLPVGLICVAYSCAGQALAVAGEWWLCPSACMHASWHSSTSLRYLAGLSSRKMRSSQQPVGQLSAYWRAWAPSPTCMRHVACTLSSQGLLTYAVPSSLVDAG